MAESIDVKHSRLEFFGLKLAHGPEVDRLVVEGDNLRIESSPLSIRLQENGLAEATISEASLQTYLTQRLPAPISKVEVQLIGGRIQVAAVAKVVFEIKALAMCRLEIVDEREIHVRLESVEPGGPVRSIIESQLDKINPVFDVCDLPVEATLDSTRVEAGSIVVTGKFGLTIGNP